MEHTANIYQCPCVADVRNVRPLTYRERYDHDVAVSRQEDPSYVPPYGRPVA